MARMKAQSKNLSKREKEVVELLLQGKSNKQIALALGITESTVEFHLKNVYSKLEVSSRAEAILKLGKSTGLATDDLGETRVEKGSKYHHTGGTFILRRRESMSSKPPVSEARKDVKMKNRLFSYFFVGLGFGVLFWFYLEIVERVMDRFRINEEYPLEVWTFISIEFLLIFGVWLIPTLFPIRSEFLRSRKVSLSVIAVIVSWVSGIFGYYLTYVVLLAFIGLPNMEYYLVFGQHGPTFWQDWVALFPKLILFKFLQRALIGVVIGGFIGLVTSYVYSLWIKTRTILPA
jgi:DNA-binding CsgD family transcriptional regulator